MNRFKFTVLILFLGFAPAFGQESGSAEKSGQAAAVEKGRAIYRVYSRVNADDYLPSSNAQKKQLPTRPKSRGKSRTNLISDMPPSFYFAMFPVFLGLLLMVLYLFVHDMEREDKVILSEELGSMDP